MLFQQYYNVNVRKENEHEERCVRGSGKFLYKISTHIKLLFFFKAEDAGGTMTWQYAYIQF